MNRKETARGETMALSRAGDILPPTAANELDRAPVAPASLQTQATGELTCTAAQISPGDARANLDTEDYCVAAFAEAVEKAFARGYQRLSASEFRRWAHAQALARTKRGQTPRPLSAPAAAASNSPLEAIPPSSPSPTSRRPAHLIQLSDRLDPDDEHVVRRVKGGALLQLSPAIRRASRGEYHLRSPRGLESLWKRAVLRNGWQHQLDRAYLETHFADIVGGPIAAHCHIESLTEDTIVLRCQSTAWAKALQSHQAELLRNLDKAAGNIIIKKLVILGPTAPSWKHGPRSVPGRGVRDTYG